jgi:hypothetical protein
MEYLKHRRANWVQLAGILSKIGEEGFTLEQMTTFYGDPTIAPAEPQVLPGTRPEERPSQDDPFNIPLPLIDPTPKGFNI